MKYTWINRNKKIHAIQTYQLSRQILSCFTQVTKPFLKTDMTVLEQRELGSSLIPCTEGGRILGGSHVFHREQKGGYQSLLTEYKLEAIEN